MAQLVGTNCVICQEKITNELDSRHCRDCGKPRHDRCVQLPDRPTDALCYECGVPVDHPKQPVATTPPPTEKPQEPIPVASVCPKCKSEKYKKVKPLGWIAFKWDRVCKDCQTRYAPPTTKWAARLFVLVGLILMLGGLFFMVLSLGSGFAPATMCELPLAGAFVVLGYRAFAHGMSAIAEPGKV